VRQTAALLMPLYGGAPSGPAKENRDGFPRSGDAPDTARYFWPSRTRRGRLSGTHPSNDAETAAKDENQHSKRSRPFSVGMPSGSVFTKAQFAILDKALNQLDHAHTSTTQALLPEGGMGSAFEVWLMALAVGLGPLLPCRSHAKGAFWRSAP
jgi:hypothetical protein